MAAIGSFVAGTLGVLGLSYLAPPLARVALRFGPFEFVMIGLAGITVLANMMGGSPVRNLALALVAGGKFPTYYGWMTYLPLCLCVCATLSRTPLPVTLRWVGLGLLGTAVGVGVLLHTAVAVYDWRDRDYRHVESLVRGSVTRTDWMFGEHAAYYAAKPVAERVFLPFYLPSMLEEEKQRLTVLVLAPGNLAEVTNVIGGSWVPTGARFAQQRRGLLGAHWERGFLSMSNYELEVFRRAGQRP